MDLAVVVVDNDGGGIFSFLPQATALAPERFEALFGTPHGLDLVALAGAYGWTPAASIPATTWAGRAVAAGGVRVLVVGTERAANVAAHRRLDGAVAAAAAWWGHPTRDARSRTVGLELGPGLGQLDRRVAVGHDPVAGEHPGPVAVDLGRADRHRPRAAAGGVDPPGRPA